MSVCLIGHKKWLQPILNRKNAALRFRLLWTATTAFFCTNKLKIVVKSLLVNCTGQRKRRAVLANDGLLSQEAVAALEEIVLTYEQSMSRKLEGHILTLFEIILSVLASQERSLSAGKGSNNGPCSAS